MKNPGDDSDFPMTSRPASRFAILPSAKFPIAPTERFGKPFPAVAELTRENREALPDFPILANNYSTPPSKVSLSAQPLNSRRTAVFVLVWSMVSRAISHKVLQHQFVIAFSPAEETAES